MTHDRSGVAETEEHLRGRVIRMLKRPSKKHRISSQLSMFDPTMPGNDEDINTPTTSISKFLGYICDIMPTGDLYLFGGILRDLALTGRRGSTSDIDLVVDGDWTHLVTYLKSRGFTRNRFGGFRGCVDGWPVDIWNGRETWAIREGLVQYRGIESLVKTTILNWDAILLNWRSKQIICHPRYFQQIRDGVMDIVLKQNPNPLGAAVRAFRHLCLKDARKLTVPAEKYLVDSARKYSTETIVKSEIGSYGRTDIQPAVLSYFRHMDDNSKNAVPRRFDGTSRILQPLLNLNMD